MVGDLGVFFFPLAAVAVVFAGVSKAGFGSGAAFASASILALVIDPRTALGMMLPLLMLIDAATLRPYWGKWDLRACGPVVLGALPGVALGVLLFRIASDDAIRILIGLICWAYVLWSMRAAAVAAAPLRLPQWLGGLAGAVAGFTSFISHAGGPPVAVYLLARGLSKSAYQASTVLIFAIVNVFKAIPYGVMGVFTAETVRLDLILVPFALFGAWLGIRLHRMIPETLFFRVTDILLFLTGSKLIWDALT